MPAITIRELRPSDQRAFAFTFGHLSDRSRYQRYLSPKPFLSARELSHLLDVDHWHHEALIAYSPPPRAPIGVARYVRLDEFDTAELAIEVADAWQGHGVGTALLAALQERAIGEKCRRTSPQTGMARSCYSDSGASSDPAGSSDPADSPPASPPPSAPTPTGVGAGAGSITVSLTSPSGGDAPSSPVAQSTITVEPDATCWRRTKSANGSST